VIKMTNNLFNELSHSKEYIIDILSRSTTQQERSFQKLNKFCNYEIGEIRKT